jgi:hypothetical protein
MAMKNLYLARPNLGNPLILRPEELNYFVVTFAYKKPGKMKEGDVPYPSTSEILNQLRRDPPKIFWGNKEVTLNIQEVHWFVRHPYFKANYGDVEHARGDREQQYYNGFRWEILAGVGIDDNKIEELKNSIGWPTLLNLRYGPANHHAIYVHETLARSNEFTILHITDTHISQRNDKIPELLSQVRNRRECELLAAKYVNFNDNLRSFIKIANERWREEGGKVIVVLTGDIVDYYFDGWWNGKFICGQGQFAPDRRKEATGSSWGYSNVSKFREIILGTDRKGEPLICPLFTVLGNHDYLMNEPPLSLELYMKILGAKLTHDKNAHDSFGLSYDEGREYDYWAYPRNDGKHRSIAKRKTFKENIKKDSWKASLDQDWSYWLAKPKSWQLSQYLRQISYDVDPVDTTLGNHKLLFINTGEDRYPRQEEFLGLEHKEDSDRDYIEGGPHNRGITSGHTGLIHSVLRYARRDGLILVFTHAPLMSLEKDETKGMDVLFEDNHDKAPPPPNAVSLWLSDLYKKTHRGLIQVGFPLTNTKYFKRGKRNPLLNFSSADGDVVEFLDRINRLTGSETNAPIFVFSGHTHKVHEFRIEKIRERSVVDQQNFLYFLNNYSNRYFYHTTNARRLELRNYWIRKNSPFLFTSGALKNKKPQYREIIVNGQSFEGIEMKEVPDIEKTTRDIPGCRPIALRAHNGQYVCAEGGGRRELVANRDHIREWETFEIIELGGNDVAFKACNGQFVRAERGGGGKLKPDRSWIRSHESFALLKRGGNKVALRAHNGQYVCAEGGGGRELVANRDHIREWETFKIFELEQLATPKQISPAHGTVFSHYPRQTTVRWEPVIGALSYTVEHAYFYDEWKSYRPISGIRTTSYTFNFVGAQPGRWRVWAVGAFGAESTKSAWWEFRYTQ